MAFSSSTNWTALFSRQQPGGMFIVQDKQEHPGNVWFVDSGASAASDTAGFGRNPDAPFATLDYAVENCTANNGDTILVMPGHAETQSASGSLFALDVAGIRVIGLGKGADRPTFTFSHTGAATTISAASIHVENIVYVCGVDSVTAPLTISAADWSLVDVEFRDTTDVEFVKGPTTTAAADRGYVSGFLYRGYTGGDACTIGISLVGCDSCIIENSTFYGEFSTACVDLTTTACSDVTVRNCTFYNDNVALTKNVVDTATGSTWQVHDSFDGKGGYSFSGGSAAAVASDDVSALTALVGAAGSTQTSDLHGKIGTDTQMNDISLYDLLVGDGPTTAPSAAAAANDVSLYEVVRYIQETLLGASTSTQTSDLHGKIGTDAQMNDISLYDLLVGDGPTTAPTSAAPGNDVSLYEVASAIYDDTATIGAATSTQTSELMGKIGTDAEMNDISLYDLLVGDGPTTAPAAAAAGNDVSLYEVARYIQETLINTAASTQTSDLQGKIGTDAEMNDRSLYDLLAGAGPSTAPSAAAAANDVSLYEVTRYISENQAWRILRNAKDVSSYTQTAYNIFTITGTVLAQVWGVCTTNIGSAGAPTMEVGISGNTAALMAQIVDGTDLDQYEVWQDATPEANPGAIDLTSRTFILAGGADVILTIGTADLNAGAIDFYCRYIPLDATGAVAAA